MKTMINYYYNLYPEDVIKNKDNYYFFYKNNKYYIVNYNKSLEDLKLYNIVNLKLNNKSNYIILINKNKELYIEYNKKDYVILKVINIEIENKELSLSELLSFNKTVKTKSNTSLNRNNWDYLWSEKIDYFEYQMSVRNIKELENSFNYYIGMAENAISYIKNTYLEEEMINELVISHNRIEYPLYVSKIVNPLELIFDYEVRDLSEYIKKMFFNNNLNWFEIEEYIKKRNYSRFELRLLYGRLLFPTYYFDIYEEIQNNNKNINDLKNIISKKEKYEALLFDIYILIKKITPIPEIGWIMKNINKN